MSAHRFWVFTFTIMVGCVKVRERLGTAAPLQNMRFAPSLIALGMFVCSSSCSRATMPSAECMRTLSNASCPASYAEAVAPGNCADFPFPMFISECGGRQVVNATIVDVAVACSYDAAGVLVGSRECSKPIGDCSCFYAGEMVPDNCEGWTLVACEADAGKPTPDSSAPSPAPTAGLDRPGPSCGEPNTGKPCTCPGTEFCPSGASFFSRCMSDGSWANTDHSCTLGLSCQMSIECPSGQVCCGEPYRGSWGTQIIFSSCRPAPCPPDLLQLCENSAECVQGSACSEADLAYGIDGGVTSCAD